MAPLTLRPEQREPWLRRQGLQGGVWIGEASIASSASCISLYWEDGLDVATPGHHRQTRNLRRLRVWFSFAPFAHTTSSNRTLGQSTKHHGSDGHPIVSSATHSQQGLSKLPGRPHLSFRPLYFCVHRRRDDKPKDSTHRGQSLRLPNTECDPESPPTKAVVATAPEKQHNYEDDQNY
jgi:hypothetical protein